MKIRFGHTLICIHPLLPFLCIISFIFDNSHTLLSSVLALLFHEAGHFLCAVICRVKINVLEMTPFGGIMLCDFSSAGKIQRILVSACGPLFSIYGYISCYLLLLYTATGVPFLLSSLRAHLLLFLINLLPVLPLDGGQIILHLFNESPSARRHLSQMGTILGIMMISLSVYYAFHRQLLLAPAFAGCCLIYAAAIEHRDDAGVSMHRIIDKKYRLEKGGLLRVSHWAAASHMTLLQLTRLLPSGDFCEVHVFNTQNGSFEGVLDTNHMVKCLLEQPHITLHDAILIENTHHDCKNKHTMV